jgi:hypothetical protein
MSADSACDLPWGRGSYKIVVTDANNVQQYVAGSRLEQHLCRLHQLRLSYNLNGHRSSLDRFSQTAADVAHYSIAGIFTAAADTVDESLATFTVRCSPLVSILDHRRH